MSTAYEWQVLAFLALVATFGLGGFGIVRRYLWGERPSEDALRAFLVAVALAVLAGTALGLAGWFRPLPAGMVAGAIGVLGAGLLARSSRPYHAPVPPLTPAARAVVCLGLGTVIANVVLQWQLPASSPDALSWHLAFPARWLQEGRIVRLPDAFHAGIHAYTPANQEVLALWWMLPFHSEVFARFLQVPFLLAGALAIYVLSTARGLTRDAGAALAGAFLIVRPLLSQAVHGTENDVMLAALFLGALHACDGVREDRTRGGWVFGVALGLFLGTKYVALPYTLPLVAAFLLARPGWRASLLALVLTLLLGGTWYGWNAVQTGDPVYPADLALGRLTLAEGLFNAGVFEKERTFKALLEAGTRQPHGLSPVLAGALGLLWLLSHVRRRGSFTASSMPLLLVLLYVAFVPFHDGRLLFPAFAALTVSAGAASSLLGARWSLLAPVTLAVIAFQEAMGTGSADLRQACLVAAAGVFVLWTSGRRLLPLPRRALLGAVAGGVLVAMGTAPRAIVVYHEAAYGSDPSRYERTNGDEGRAWTWLHEATRTAPTTVARTGTGASFPLFGARLRNRVIYVPVRPGPEALVHEYGIRITGPGADPLAAASEAARSPVDRDEWLARIERHGVRYLLVVSAGEDGTPLVERTWADGMPERFHVELRLGDVTLYSVVP